MDKHHRRLYGRAGMACCALFAPALISVITGPLASADPAADVAAAGQIVTLGPIPFDGFTDTLAFNDSTFAFDNYLIGTVDGSFSTLTRSLAHLDRAHSRFRLPTPGFFSSAFSTSTVRFV